MQSKCLGERVRARQDLLQYRNTRAWIHIFTACQRWLQFVVSPCGRRAFPARSVVCTGALASLRITPQLYMSLELWSPLVLGYKVLAIFKHTAVLSHRTWQKMRTRMRQYSMYS